MSTSITTPVIGYDLRSPSSPCAVSAWAISDPFRVYPYHHHSPAGFQPHHSSPASFRSSRHHYSQEDPPSSSPPCYAVAYGTERGSLHYRIYPSLRADGTPAIDPQGLGTSSSSSRIFSTSSTAAGGGIISPLSSNVGGPTSTIIDMSNAYPGSIVSMVRLTPSLTPLFLVLVDDHKGSGPQSSTTSSGSYSSVWRFCCWWPCFHLIRAMCRLTVFPPTSKPTI